MKLTLDSMADVAQDVREAIEAGEVAADCRIVIEERVYNDGTYFEWYPMAQYQDRGVLRIWGFTASVVAGTQRGGQPESQPPTLQ